MKRRGRACMVACECHSQRMTWSLHACLVHSTRTEARLGIKPGMVCGYVCVCVCVCMYVCMCVCVCVCVCIIWCVNVVFVCVHARNAIQNTLRSHCETENYNIQNAQLCMSLDACDWDTLGDMCTCSRILSLVAAQWQHWEHHHANPRYYQRNLRGLRVARNA